MIERMDWDSRYFGCEMYRIDAPTQECVDEAKANGAGRVQWRGRADHDVTCLAINMGFRLVDDLVVMRRGLDGLPLQSPNNGMLLSHPTLEEAEVLLRMGDFPHSRIGPLGYGHYLAKGDRLGILLDGQWAGLSAWSERNGLIYLDLLFVVPRAQGQGIGKKLLTSTLYEMRRLARGDEVETATWVQEQAALRLYRNGGFRAVERRQTWWLDLEAT